MMSLGKIKRYPDTQIEPDKNQIKNGDMGTINFLISKYLYTKYPYKLNIISTIQIYDTYTMNINKHKSINHYIAPSNLSYFIWVSG